ncbi:MAG: type II toxin-antitoxin system VapC family toxin [Tannerella sp.]|jgi:predicted nucleic acid-binding protein|nr:type II toxin-antitoxin system VapC family toxin [Tannerella sp.]
MNGNSFLIDTNIIIYVSKDILLLEDFVRNEDALHISSITYIEAMGFPFQNVDEEAKVVMCCNKFKRLFLTEEVERQTILIRKSNKIKLPDAIIAATAIVHNLTLITCNSADFKDIKGIKILNPHER